MPLIVNTNIASLNTQRQLTIANNAINKSLERLSSGLRINRASDDAAGLAIATRLQAQVRGLQQASRNARLILNPARPLVNRFTWSKTACHPFKKNT